jgi:hypothetical protein
VTFASQQTGNRTHRQRPSSSQPTVLKEFNRGAFTQCKGLRWTLAPEDANIVLRAQIGDVLSQRLN